MNKKGFDTSLRRVIKQVGIVQDQLGELAAGALSYNPIKTTELGKPTRLVTEASQALIALLEMGPDGEEKV